MLIASYHPRTSSNNRCLDLEHHCPGITSLHLVARREIPKFYLALEKHLLKARTLVRDSCVFSRCFSERVRILVFLLCLLKETAKRESKDDTSPQATLQVSCFTENQILWWHLKTPFPGERPCERRLPLLACPRLRVLHLVCALPGLAGWSPMSWNYQCTIGAVLR